MGTQRLEAFSDGVLAIIITIMVLELKVPHSAEFAALESVLPVFMSYVLSFHLRRHLLEQSSPPVPFEQTRKRRYFVGEPAPVVLAFALSLRDWMDG